MSVAPMAAYNCCASLSTSYLADNIISLNWSDERVRRVLVLLLGGGLSGVLALRLLGRLVVLVGLGVLLRLGRERLVICRERPLYAPSVGAL